jgi:hypothetical protein
MQVRSLETAIAASKYSSSGKGKRFCLAGTRPVGFVPAHLIEESNVNNNENRSWPRHVRKMRQNMVSTEWTRKS